MRHRSPENARDIASRILTEPPFFIVGSGRSGTTLMRSLLSSHSRLAVTPETHFLKSCIRLGGVPLDTPPPDFDGFWRAYCATPRFASLGIAPEDVEPYLAQGGRTFAATFEALLAAYLAKTGKARVGEKTPSHLHHADWLFRTFSDTRVIAMQRDPRAMIASLLKTPWRRGEDDLARSPLARGTRLHAVIRDARRWSWVNGEILPRLAADPRVMTVRYEDLVQDAAARLRAVCDFLGETFEPAMLDRRAGAGVDPAAAGMNPSWAPWLRTHEASASAPIGAGSLQKWRTELSAREVATIEAVSETAMRSLGYLDFVTTPAERRAALRAARAAGGLHRVERLLRHAVRGVIGPAR